MQILVYFVALCPGTPCMASVVEFRYWLQKSLLTCIKVSVVKKIETTLLFFQVPKPEKSQVPPTHSQIGHYFFSYLLTCEVNLIDAMQ
jgi:hypothetical protein